jgi:tetratricopeptide (TPR) repeat protein
MDLTLRRTSGSDPREQARLLRRLGRIWHEKLGRRAEAVEIYRDLIALEEGYPRRWSRELAEQMATRLEHRLARAENDAERIALYIEQARLLEKAINDKVRGFAALVRASRLNPNNTIVLEKTVQLGVAVGKLAELSDLLEELSTRQDRHTRAATLRKLGRVRAALTGGDALGMWALREASRLDPFDQRAFAEVEAQAIRHRLWDDLVSIYLDRNTDLADPASRVSLLCRAAEVCESELGERRPAIQLYRKVLGIQPEHPEAIAAINRLMTI